MPIARVLSQAGSKKETGINTEEVTMLSLYFSFRKGLGSPGKHQVQAKSVMHPKQQRSSTAFWAASGKALPPGGGKCFYSALTENLEHCPVLGSPVQKKHRHTADQQEAASMVRGWSTCHKRMSERAETAQPPEKMFQQRFNQCV